MQLCVVQDGRGDLQSLSSASTQRGLDAWARCSLVLDKQSTVLWTASVERNPATLCSLDQTVLHRSVNAALLRLTKSASIASLSMLWLGAAASTRWCCNLELVQPKKASRAKPTVLLHLYRDPATPQFRTCSA